MANDPQRDKARAIFGKAFFENSKALPNPKNSAAALQQRANARPIPTYKVGGAVKKNPEVAAMKGAQRAVKAEQDFSKPLREAVLKAAAKGTPVMKEGGPTDEYTAKRVRARMETGNYKKGGKVARKMDGGGARDNAASKISAGAYKEGGDAARYAKTAAKYDTKLARKKEDIEKDYQKALAKGKNADVAKAKRDQRMADAADDFAKWTKGDRTATKAAEKAAEQNLKTTRKYGAKPTESLVKKAETSVESKAPLSSAGATPTQKIEISKPSARKAAAPRKVAAPVRRVVATKVSASAPKVSASAPKVTTPAPRTVAAAAPQRGTAAAAKASPYAKDKSGNYVDTSSAGSRARLGALFGIGGGEGAGTSRAYGALADIARKRDAEKAAKQAAEEANRNAKIPVRSKLATDPYGYYGKKDGGKVGKYAVGGAGKVRKGMTKGK